MAERSRDYLQQYREAMAWLESGRQERVAALLEDWRKEVSRLSSAVHSSETRRTFFIETFRRLLSTRLAMKNGLDVANIETLLDPARIDDPYQRGECWMVQGLYFYNRADYTSGWPLFARAEAEFQSCDQKERALLAAYNLYIGQLNSDELSPDQESASLLELEQRARSLDQFKALAWILRQKSYFLQEQGRLHGALAVTDEAISLLLKQGPLSDLHLAYLQAADCLIDLGQPAEAKARVDLIMGPIDSRVRFPMRYIAQRLGLEQTDPQEFSDAPPLWREKWAKQFGEQVAKKNDERVVLSWNLKTGVVARGKQKLENIAPDTLEGRVLRLVSERPRSKSYLCEILWPEDCEKTVLDNRLHRIISRLNKRIPSLIIFREGHYQTSRVIKIDRKDIRKP